MLKTTKGCTNSQSDFNSNNSIISGFLLFVSLRYKSKDGAEIEIVGKISLLLVQIITTIIISAVLTFLFHESILELISEIIKSVEGLRLPLF